MKIKLIYAFVGTAFLSACTSSPKMITQDEMGDIAREEMKVLHTYDRTEPLNLHEAISYVLLRNNDIFTKRYEQDIADGEKLFANLDFLPQVTANYRRVERDKLLLTTSTRLGEPAIPGVDTTPSYSSLLETETESLRVSWDLLNVLKNFLTSKQKGNNQLVARLNTEKAAQNVFSDTFPAFNLAAINQHEGQLLSQTSERLQNQINLVCSQIAEERTLNEALAESCSGALSSYSKARGLVRALRESTHNFKALISVDANTPVPLARPDYSDPGSLAVDVDALIDFAVSHRPELGIEIYKQRNAKLEKKKAWMDILPSVEVAWSDNETDNPFTVNQEWEEESLDITWNILGKVVRAPLRAKQEERRYMLANSRYRALLVVVMTQTQIGYDAYTHARNQWLTSFKRHAIADKKKMVSDSKFNNGAISQMDYLKNTVEYLVSTLELQADYVRMIDALAMLYNSIGVPVMPSLNQAETPAHLTKLIGDQLAALSIIEKNG